MSDPFRTEQNRLPEPANEFRGITNKDGVGARAFASIAKLWQPRGTTAESPASTVSRFSMRLIDRLTGKAYSADELLGRISNPGSAIIVDPVGTDAQRGLALVSAYAEASTLKPNGAALSDTNRAVVILPPGSYQLATTLELDTDFVDIVAQFPQRGGDRQATDEDDFIEFGGTPLEFYRPPPTVIYTETTSQISTICQTAADVRLHGFGIALLGDPTAWTAVAGLPAAALMIGKVGLDVDNSASQYSMMYFWSRAAYFEDFGGVRGYWSFRGTWLDCIASACSFRAGYGDNTNFPAEIVFEANMEDCQAGPFSYLGDAWPGENYLSRNSTLRRCRAIGKHYDLNGPVSTESGFAAFGGCTAKGLAIGSTVSFYDCDAGPNSFGNGSTSQGTYIRCRGGSGCFGATVDATNFGVFSGYAEDCFAGADSFGGRNSLSDASNASAYNSGTMVRCQSLGHTRPINLDGAVIRDSRITITTTNQNAVVLLDSDSKIYNSDLIVVQGGTGVPIHAGTAKNVVACHLRMNNASTDADGLHANVTNLIGTPLNIIDNDIA